MKIVKEDLETLENIPGDAVLNPTMAKAKEVAQEKAKHFEKVIKEVTPEEPKEPKMPKSADLKKLHLSEELDDPCEDCDDEDDVDESCHKESLNEEFSSSMPKWLKDRLIFSSIRDNTPYNKQQKRKDAYISRGYDFSKQVNTGKFIHTLLSSDIDLEHANFIEAPVPKNARDPLVKDPYIPFFHVMSDGNREQVYARGINEDERMWTDDVQFKYHSMKDLLAHTIDFCYLDKNDASNFKAPNLALDRFNKNKDLENSPLRRYTPAEQADHGGKNRFDKSGYIIDPDKYRRKLDSLGRNDIQGTLDRYYDEIMNIKSRYVDSLNRFDPKRLSSRDEFNRIFKDRWDGLISDFGNLCDDYNELCNRVDNALAETNAEDRDARLDAIFGSADREGPTYIQNLRNSIRDLVNKNGQVFTSKINWRESLDEADEEGDETIDERNTLWNRVYQELDGQKQDPPFLVKAPRKGRYGYERIGTDKDGNIIVYAPNEEDLDLAKRVAEYFNLEIEIKPVIGNEGTETAVQAKIIIPENKASQLPRMDVRVSNITWDLEDDADTYTAADLDLPSNIDMEVPVAVVNNKRIKQAVFNKLADEYGYKPVNFTVEMLGGLKHQPSDIDEAFNLQVNTDTVDHMVDKSSEVATNTVNKLVDNPEGTATLDGAAAKVLPLLADDENEKKEMVDSSLPSEGIDEAVNTTLIKNDVKNAVNDVKNKVTNLPNKVQTNLTTKLNQKHNADSLAIDNSNMSDTEKNKAHIENDFDYEKKFTAIQDPKQALKNLGSKAQTKLTNKITQDYNSNVAEIDNRSDLNKFQKDDLKKELATKYNNNFNNIQNPKETAKKIGNGTLDVTDKTLSGVEKGLGVLSSIRKHMGSGSIPGYTQKRKATQQELDKLKVDYPDIDFSTLA